MPRQSSIERSTLALISSAGTLPSPPEAPPELSEAEREVWNAVVRSRPRVFNAFELRILVSAYSRHAVAVQSLSEQIAKIEIDINNPAAIAKLDKLMGMRARETASMLRLAARLRFLPTRSEPSGPQNLPWRDEH
jgi:hypothetical protein